MNNLIYKIILFRPMFGRYSRLVTLRIFPTIFRQESNNAIAFTHQGAIDIVIDMEEWISELLPPKGRSFLLHRNNLH